MLIVLVNVRSWEKSIPFLLSSPSRAGDLLLPSVFRALSSSFPWGQLQPEVLVNSDGLGVGGWNIPSGEERTHPHPTESHSLQFGVVLVLPSCSVIFQTEVGWVCRRRRLYPGPWLALAQRFQLRMSGPACAAGLASLPGQGVERPRPGSSKKS